MKLCDVCAECRETRLLSLFRFKIWWMIPRVGSSAKDIPVETQMLLLEEPYSEEADENTAYVLFLPILDGEFRSSLQGNLANELEVCVESGMYCLLDVNCLSWSHYVQKVLLELCGECLWMDFGLLLYCMKSSLLDGMLV